MIGHLLVSKLSFESVAVKLVPLESSQLSCTGTGTQLKTCAASQKVQLSATKALTGLVYTLTPRWKMGGHLASNEKRIILPPKSSL